MPMIPTPDGGTRHVTLDEYRAHIRAQNLADKAALEEAAARTAAQEAAVTTGRRSRRKSEIVSQALAAENMPPMTFAEALAASDTPAEVAPELGGEA